MAFEDYARPSVAVDVVALTLRENSLQVLLIRRENPPHRGYWAFPGGFVDIDEALEDAAIRELEEETGVRDVRLEQLHTFGDPRRDPRGRVISVAFLALIAERARAPRAGDDAAEARWWPAHDPPSLAFDHDLILDRALKRLRARTLHAPAGVDLLPGVFDLRELHRDYQSIIGDTIDWQDFSNSLLKSGLIEETAGVRPDSDRGDRSYRFRPEAVAEASAYRHLP